MNITIAIAFVALFLDNERSEQTNIGVGPANCSDDELLIKRSHGQITWSNVTYVGSHGQM